MNVEEYEQAMDALFQGSALRWPLYEETEADIDSEHALEHRWGFDTQPWEEPRHD